MKGALFDGDFTSAEKDGKMADAICQAVFRLTQWFALKKNNKINLSRGFPSSAKVLLFKPCVNGFRVQKVTIYSG